MATALLLGQKIWLHSCLNAGIMGRTRDGLSRPQPPGRGGKPMLRAAPWGRGEESARRELDSSRARFDAVRLGSAAGYPLRSSAGELALGSGKPAPAADELAESERMCGLLRALEFSAAASCGQG